MDGIGAVIIWYWYVCRVCRCNGEESSDEFRLVCMYICMCDFCPSLKVKDLESSRDLLTAHLFLPFSFIYLLYYSCYCYYLLLLIRT